MLETRTNYKIYILGVGVILFFGVVYFIFSNTGKQVIKPEDNPVLQTDTKENLGEKTLQPDKFFTLNEVRMHPNKTDCWMAIEGKVYDVTSFIEKHPGGERILQGCGKDATSLFQAIPKHASGIVKMLMNKYEIGELR